MYLRSASIGRRRNEVTGGSAAVVFILSRATKDRPSCLEKCFSVGMKTIEVGGYAKRTPEYQTRQDRTLALIHGTNSVTNLAQTDTPTVSC